MKPALALSFAILMFASVSQAQNATAAQVEAHSQAQSQPPAEAASTPPQVNPYTPGCGPGNEKFELKTEPNMSQPDPAPAPGKALIYFVQDDRYFTSHPRPTLKWGIDGNWVGATRSRTFVYADVDPGEHHICAQWQTGVIVTQPKQTAVAHFNAEPGHVYYFRAQNVVWRDVTTAAVNLEPVDSDEGALLSSQSGYSVATLKK